ncbi:hypothetical protein IM40_09205 [Candidatus Paracaedimonas acanthamoebae]|nr:hypothetical protein IM40_09205 [Candidatus Paracaedimonas acanthamoebae]
MKKILTILCLSVGCVHLGFASDLSSDEQTKLTRLQLRATHCFEVGRYEQERLDRIAILKLQPNFENLRLAVQLCMTREKFKEGEDLLRDYYSCISNSEAKILRDYMQDEKIRSEERLFNRHIQRPLNNRIQRPRTFLSRVLSIFKYS